MPPLWVKKGYRYYITSSRPLRSILSKPSHSTGVVGSIENNIPVRRKESSTFAFLKAMPERGECIRGKPIRPTTSI